MLSIKMAARVLTTPFLRLTHKHGIMDIPRSPSVRLPTDREIEDIAEHHRLNLSKAEFQAIQNEIHESLKDYDLLDDCEDVEPYIKYPRTPGQRPKPAENVHNGWCWRCDIPGAGNGKLAGKTFAIKDSISIAGVPLRFGSHILHGYTPDYDATVVTRILDAGGHIIGKSTTEDFSISGSSFTSSSGPVKNPYDASRAAGGSSSGSATLVAHGVVDMALGTDQGGSIRGPASWCGIVGLKPTWGLVPYSGIFAMEPTVDHVGPMTKNVYDCALLLEVLAGYDNGFDPRQPVGITVPEYTKQLTKDLSGIRVGMLAEGFQHPGGEYEVNNIVKSAAHRLQEVGATIEDVSVPMHIGVSVVVHWEIVRRGIHHLVSGNSFIGTRGEYVTSLEDTLHNTFQSQKSQMSLNLKLMFITGEYLKSNYGQRFYAKSRNIARQLTAKYDEVLENYDVLVLPTRPKAAKKLPSKDLSVKECFDESAGNGVNTLPFNVTGHPAISINAGFKADGLPVGMMIVGKHFDESTVLKVAYAFEKLTEPKLAK